jgi:hypothetical protein
MAIINYKKEYVSFDYKNDNLLWDGSGGDWVIPSIEFFIHVWQRANSLKDVRDTFEHAFEAHGNSETHVLSLRAISSRAARWRGKGVPLKTLTQTNTLGALKRFAEQEAL